jgi:branched-chain amino acid transport system ATP-binding protein
MSAELVVRDLTTGYTRAPILRSVSLEVGMNEAVGVLGANGAGKTTLLRAISGAVRAWSGSVVFFGHDVTRASPWARVELGLAHVPEGRHIFSAMSVSENLTVAGLVAGRHAPRLDDVFGTFPQLGRRRNQVGGTLSGGEQQMLAIARALMTGPRGLIVDELSSGLAPIITEQLVEGLKGVSQAGVCLLVVEQSPHTIADLVDRVYLMEQGRVVGEGSLTALGGPDRIADLYLGVH